jgi:L-threonylcarbamoyladenylate synthase
LAGELTAGTGKVGVRLPAGAELCSLLRQCGGALTATSANPAGQAPARTAREVVNYFPTGLSLILDGGTVDITKPSTVLDLSGTTPFLIREGAISRDSLKEFLWTLGRELV